MRPLTFLTVQKSRERRRMMRTKLPMKLSENHPHNRYTVGEKKRILIVRVCHNTTAKVVKVPRSASPLKSR